MFTYIRAVGMLFFVVNGAGLKEHVEYSDYYYDPLTYIATWVTKTANKYTGKAQRYD